MTNSNLNYLEIEWTFIKFFLEVFNCYLLLFWMLCCFELSCISFNEYYPMKFQFLKVILVLFEFYFYIMLCHMHIINLYAKYIWIFKFGGILLSVLRSPDSRSNYPNPILRRISSLTTLPTSPNLLSHLQIPSLFPLLSEKESTEGGGITSHILYVMTLNS